MRTPSLHLHAVTSIEALAASAVDTLFICLTQSEILKYQSIDNYYLHIRFPAAEIFTPYPGRAATRYYALLKGNLWFCPGLLITIFAANLQIWRPFHYPQPVDPVDGSYLHHTTNFFKISMIFMCRLTLIWFLSSGLIRNMK